MKNGRTMVTMWIIIISALVAGGYIFGFQIYKDYEENFDRQTQFTLTKFEEVENNLRELAITLENTADENKIERKKALSQIGNIREDFKDLRNDYRAALVELKETIEDLGLDRLKRTVEKMQDEISGVKITMQDLEFKEEIKGVDLGKISVKKEEKPKKRRR